jgi:beta-N-acetylhexosaminidase
MEKKRSVHLILIWLLIFTVFPTINVYAQEGTQDSFAQQQAMRMLEGLSPAEKVGQLFLVTFDGAEVSSESDLYQLIKEFHIGGVVIKQENGNIPEDNPQEALPALIDLIQQTAYEKAMETDTANIEIGENFIPLFIGASQNGGSYPYDQVLTGMNQIPSPMSIGATWDPEIALHAGEAFGYELEVVGFNLLLGPSMDVQDMSFSSIDRSLGVRTFGGDPFWVGEMGSQFITGLHRGSSGRLAVIAKNFPGRGSTDRLPEEEVSTVRKSLEQLKLIELAPFFKIASVGTAIPAAITDGLVTSHIRYQGFQGNIRATTKPISFDQNAIGLLMDIIPLNKWRDEGGLLISDDLGSPAIIKFFNPNNQFIDARQIAKNAFLAGNDILLIEDLISTGDANRFQTYQSVITFFQQKYIEDSAFAQQVDNSVIRILTLKYELYNEFSLDQVLPAISSYSAPISIDDLQFEIAKTAATLVDPSQNQLAELIAEPPQFSDRIIIFTQDQTIIPCENCPPIEVFPVNGLQRSILSFYGPEGSNQINPNRIISYSFRDLSDYLNNPINRPEIDQNLSSADWVVFALREPTSGELGDEALRQLISDNQTLTRGKNVIVFAFDAPYYFDATEISFFTAYYNLYSKLPAFIDVAARILFQELTPSSASPVSIPGIGYDLIEQVTPDADQIISLAVDLDAAKLLLTEPQDENSPIQETPVFKLGDTLPIMTGVIVDHNGNLVPDGTIVTFTMSEQGDSSAVQQVETQTTRGIAKTSFNLIKSGMHEIRVSSSPATNSEILLLDISEFETTVSEIIPTPIPINEGSDDLQEELTETPDTATMDPNPKFAEWFLGTIMAWIFGGIVFTVIRDYFLRFENYLISGAGVIGGLFNSAWMVFDLPGTTPRFGMNGFVRLGMVVLLGVAMGAFAGWILLKIGVVRLGDEHT